VSDVGCVFARWLSWEAGNWCRSVGMAARTDGTTLIWRAEAGTLAALGWLARK